MQAVAEEVASDLEVTLERHLMAHRSAGSWTGLGVVDFLKRGEVEHDALLPNSYGASEENAP